MYGAIAIIATVIVIWCCFDAKTAPGVTQYRPYGITALVALGCGICFSPSPAPVLIICESLLASVIICVLLSAILLIGGGDRPSPRYRLISRVLIGLLFVTTVAVAYLVGGVFALQGALAGVVVMLLGAAYVIFGG